MRKNKSIILVSLNELNFDVVNKFLLESKFKTFQKIKNNLSTTISETNYSKLEPWIQWLSIYYGLKADEHKIERLGENFKGYSENIFQSLEKKGFTVGAISPMNLENNLNSPTFFFPDPWTETQSDNSFWSKLIHNTTSIFVKNNARNKINFTHYIKLLLIFFKFARLQNYFEYLKFFKKGIKKKWCKALFLDLLLHDIHMKKINENKVEFSNIFFNSLAHIQHHYFFNSINSDDNKKNPEWYVNINDNPLKDGVELFEKILNDYIKLSHKFKIIIATGLTQIPYDRLKYYYRLKNHEKFFNNFEINFDGVQELMSRDFVLKFASNEKAYQAYKRIKNIKISDGTCLFGDLNLNKEKLFLTLVINREITEKDIFYNFEKTEIKLIQFVDFVAIKNGMHDGKGFIYFSDRKINNNFEIHKLKNLIEDMVNE